MILATGSPRDSNVVLPISWEDFPEVAWVESGGVDGAVVMHSSVCQPVLQLFYNCCTMTQLLTEALTLQGSLNQHAAKTDY